MEKVEEIFKNIRANLPKLNEELNTIEIEIHVKYKIKDNSENRKEILEYIEKELKHLIFTINNLTRRVEEIKYE